MHYCDSVRMLQWTRVLATAHQLRATSWCTVCSSVGESGSGQQKLNCARSSLVNRDNPSVLLFFYMWWNRNKQNEVRLRCSSSGSENALYTGRVAMPVPSRLLYLCACSHRDSRAGTNMRFVITSTLCACGRSTHTWGCCYTPLHAAPMQMREHTRRWHMLCSSERREFV